MGEQGINPIIAALGLSGLGLLTLMVAKSVRSFAFVLALVLFIASLAPHITWDDRVYQTWLLPLQSQRSTVFAALGGVLLAGVVFQMSSARGFRFPGQSMWLLAILVYAGVLRFVHDGAGEGGLSLVLALLMVPTITFAAGTFLQRFHSIEALVRSIMFFGMMWVFAAFVQFIINRSMVITTNPVRFIGVSGNPQNAAILLAPLGVLSLWLALNDPKRVLRPVWYTSVALLVVLLLWTGSRTGMLMLAVGGAFTAYRRIGGMIFILPVMGVLLMVLLEVVQAAGIDLATERFSEGGDTRSERWIMLWHGAMDNLAIGAGNDANFGTENSLLYAFASYGIGMLVLVVGFMVFSAWQNLRLFRLRRGVDAKMQAGIDLFVAFNAAYFVGSVFEGYIISRVSVSLVMFLMFAAVGSYLLSEARYRIWEAQGEPLDDDGEWEMEQPAFG